MGKFAQLLSKTEQSGSRISPNPLGPAPPRNLPEEVDALRLQPTLRENPKPFVASESLQDLQVRALIAPRESVMTEQFRKLSTALYARYQASSLRSILVTSMAAGEGKTTVSLNLGARLADVFDTSVILIDADLRKNGLTALLGLGNAPGLSDVLSRQKTVDEVLIQTEIPGLRVLPAGLNSSNITEQLASNRMREIIDYLKTYYETTYCIYDSPPFLITSEPAAMSQMVDGTIIVLLAERTRRDIAIRELTAIDKSKILGVILNKAEFETQYYYGKYYKAYYGDKTK